MSEIPLPLDRFSSDAYFTALEDLATRYTQEETPIHYKKAAINHSKATTSSCLKFFSDIGLIEAEKAGVYVPSKSVIDFFRKIGKSKTSAQEDIKKSLIDYDVFSEVIFLVGSGNFTKEELSQKVAGQLDIDKENISSVATAIDIFDLFGFIDISDEGLVKKSSTTGTASDTEESGGGMEPDDADSESAQQVFDDLSTEEMPDIDFPPTRGSPDDLLTIVEVLSLGGAYSTDEIVDGVEFSKRKIQRLTQYGVALGFVEEEDGYQLTDRGYELSFSSNEEEQERWFKEAISQYSSYRYILQASFEELGKDTDTLDSPVIEKELRTTFGFTSNSKDSVRKAINTLLQTVEAAGLGEYIVGRGSKSTRIEASPALLKPSSLEIYLRESTAHSTCELTA